MVFLVIRRLRSPHALRPVERALDGATLDVSELALWDRRKAVLITRNRTLYEQYRALCLYRTLNTRYVCVASLNAESDRRFSVMRREPPAPTALRF